MNIIDHLSVGVSDVAQARRFYDPVLESLQVACLAANDGFAAYGRQRVQFLAMLPADLASATSGNGSHICFSAPSRAAVDEFHRLALSHGGRDNGRPGPRPDYPKADVYAAFVIDPFGNKLEAIHNGFAA